MSTRMTARVPNIGGPNGGPNGWVWTPEQWAEIASCATRAVACREGAAFCLAAKPMDPDRLGATARAFQKRARQLERRILFLASQWGVL